MTTATDSSFDLPTGASLERNRKVLEIVNDTFDLISRHRSLLIRPFIQTVLLPITIGNVLVNLFLESSTQNLQGDMIFMSDVFTSGSDSLDLLLCLVGLVLTFVGTMWGIALYNALVLAELQSDEPVGAGEPVGVGEIFHDRYRELRSMAVAAGLGLVMIAVVIIFPLAFIIQIPLIGVLLTLVLLVLVPLYAIRLSLFFPARLIEENSFSDAFSRSIELVQGAWWRTLGLVLIGMLITALLSMAGYLPMIIYAMIAGVGLIPQLDPTDPSIVALTVVLGAIYGIGQSLGLVTHLSLALHFLARRDVRDVTSLQDAIERIGRVGNDRENAELRIENAEG